MSLTGHATREGTRRYAERRPAAKGHFREAGDLLASSIGIGTYLGNADDRTDRLVADAVVDSVRGGVNVVDSAINYRLERAERSIGEALRRIVDSGEAARDEVIVCTKGGFIPSADPASYFQTNYGGKLAAPDLAAGCHCMHPDYLLDQLDRSLRNLGLETIDVYYIHNPETQLAEIDPELFYKRLGAAFGALEGAAKQGKIRAYGMATWNAFRVPSDAPDHVDLKRAREVGGDRFRFLQLPLNVVMPEAIFAPTQAGVPALEAARSLGIATVASAAICQAQVIRKLPAWMSNVFGGKSGAQTALQFTRSTPGLLTALVGMKAPRHVEENLALVSTPPVGESEFREKMR